MAPPEIGSPFNDEPRRESVGEQEQRLASVVVQAARLFLSLELHDSAVATLIADVMRRWPSLSGAK